MSELADKTQPGGEAISFYPLGSIRGFSAEHHETR
jgi:hypothetical protein